MVARLEGANVVSGPRPCIAVRDRTSTLIAAFGVAALLSAARGRA